MFLIGVKACTSETIPPSTYLLWINIYAQQGGKENGKIIYKSCIYFTNCMYY